jgi:soluble lytic murein transglycosylase-like protein
VASQSTRWSVVSLCAAVIVCGSALPARAELLFFTGGRNLSIKAHRIEGDSVIATLRSGGEMIVDRAMVERIAPDEVPYPEPADPKAAAEEQGPGESFGNRAYDAIIDRVAKEQGVDAKLVRALIQVESAYQQRAVSRKGAMGLMQLMPRTARQYAVADPYDPASNIEGGIRHLKTLLDRWPRDLALAAYNAGEAAVEKFRGIPPYPETREYVARILQLIGR